METLRERSEANKDGYVHYVFLNGKVIFIPFDSSRKLQDELRKKALDVERDELELDKVDVPHCAKQHKELIDAFVECEKEIQAQSVSFNDRNKGSFANSKPIKRMGKQSSPNRRALQIFDSSQLEALRAKAKRDGGDKKRMKDSCIADAESAGGLRYLPSIFDPAKTRAAMHEQFPNFRGATDHLLQELVLADRGSPSDFRVAPILLNGAPGIGKTHFGQRVACLLGVPFFKIGAAGLQGPFQINGTSQHWSTSSPGCIFNMLSKHDSATFVLLIDEVDKINVGQDHNPIPVLLDLLEPDTALKFKDESLEIDMDASRLIILMTSNNASFVDPALLSRCHQFNVIEPNETERRVMALRIHADLQKKARKRIKLDETAFDVLMENVTDLRVMTRAIRSAFALALMEKKKIAIPTFTQSKTPIRFN